MRNKVCIALTLIILISLQMTFGEYIKICNVKPNIMLVFTLLLSIYAMRNDLFFGGVVSGLLKDFLSSRVIGMYLITDILLCMIMYSLRRRSFRKDFFIFVPVAFIAFFLYDSVAYFLTAFPRSLEELFFVFSNYLLVGALYNTICAGVVFLIMKNRKKIV